MVHLCKQSSYHSLKRSNLTANHYACMLSLSKPDSRLQISSLEMEHSSDMRQTSHSLVQTSPFALNQEVCAGMSPAAQNREKKF